MNAHGVRRFLAGFAATLVVSAAVSAQSLSADSPSIRLIAATCQTCHGVEGRAQGVGLRLVGQGAAELERKLIGFRNGTLPGTVMPRHAKGYSEAELKALAEYFGRFK
ncbi:MAG: c-type cytochrome [Casimicrobiaceae bacterium]|nr:c-type cytochrome [Casimicrobiaceae bacterium]MCX8099600.1 c-type cytochrome [Casimicrobiaceae bacterium]MDW8312720.1 c-type cytochrome [Burkholderiales bacterium]